MVRMYTARQEVVWCWVAVAVLCGLISVTDAYHPDEKECPVKVNHHIFSPQYWVVPGTPHRAWRTLPWRLFSIAPSLIPEAGLGVFANTFIAKNTWLGEYDGEFLNLAQASEADDFEYTWRVYTDETITHYVDAGDEKFSNWLRFINTPIHSSRENVKMYTCYGRVYYKTDLDILPGEEMYVYYGDDYIEDNLGMNATEYRMKEFAPK